MRGGNCESEHLDTEDKNMQARYWIPAVCGLIVAGVAAGSPNSGAEKLKNDQVVVTEYVLHPGESLAVDGKLGGIHALRRPLSHQRGPARGRDL